MFRMNRDKYVSRDVLSDDEDMEVGAMEVEREEKRSGKLARQEDLEAEEEERRHMEEKRRRKKELQRGG
jgi:protein SPT2